MAAKRKSQGSTGADLFSKNKAAKPPRPHFVLAPSAGGQSPKVSFPCFFLLHKIFSLIAVYLSTPRKCWRF
jgi:hypothetical protein